MIRIIHLSDFHYKDNHALDFSTVGGKIADVLKTEDKIDFAVFTGDLVYQDAKETLLEDAYNCLFAKMMEVTHLDPDHILIVPGNHDLNQNIKEMKMVAESLQTKNSSKDIDTFCDDKDQLSLSITRFEPFLNFLKTKYTKAHISELYTTLTTVIAGKKCGFISLNSAWRSIKSDQDRGNLLFPKSQINDAIKEVGDSDLIFCSMHHNISDFKEFIADDVENCIYDKCHVLFTGHYHKAKYSQEFLSSSGLLHVSGYATYNRDDKQSHYGFTILNIDEISYSVSIQAFDYDGVKFNKLEPLTTSLPMSKEKQAENELRKVIRKHLNRMSDKADNLFVSERKSESAGHTFRTLFNSPVIKDKSAQEILISGKQGTKWTVDKIKDSNESFILFGRNKSGKTTILFKIILDLLSNYASLRDIPFFLSYRDYKGKEIDLIKLLREYLELNSLAVENLLKSYRLTILIDDIDIADTVFIKCLFQEMAKFPDVRLISTASESYVSQCAAFGFEDQKVKKLYIHDVTSREVHELACKWPNVIPDLRREYEEKIIQILTQMHMPFNYWTISLFLWIFEKTDPSNVHNNFELLNLYIDEILGKTSIVLDKSFKVDYEDLKSYLGTLAVFILKHRYHIKYTSLVSFTNDYIEQHKKFNEGSKTVLDLLFDKNILIYEKDDKCTFRLNGVFEYFLAYHMSENDEFRNDVLSDMSTYLSFGNELELYSGFKKDDIETVRKIFGITQVIFKPVTDNSEYYDIDNRLVQTIVVPSIAAIACGDLFERMSDFSDEDARDLLPIPEVSIESTSIKEKEVYSDIPPELSNLEKAIFILSRVYRNSKACDQQQLSNDILDFVLNGTSNLGFMLSEETRRESSKDDKSYKNIVEIMANYMPIIVEAFLYDAISQHNLERVFKTKLEQLIKTPENNEMRIFLLSFVLVDLNPKGNSALISQAIEVIRNKCLRFAIINKSMLIMLTNAENKALIEKIKDAVMPLSTEFKEYKNLADRITNEVTKRALEDKMKRS